MKRIISIKKFLIIFLLNFETAIAKINNKIVANVGNQIITDLDIENEIKTMLILKK